MIAHERPEAARPVILLVDDDDEALAALQRELQGRYGRDYTILAERAPAAALGALERLARDGAEVALVIADQWMPELPGVELLDRVHQLHPASKRILLVEGIDQTALGSLLQATALGRVDHHIHKPWVPADDQLHPEITQLLAEWTRATRPRFEMVRIVGERWEPRSHELRDVLDRNSVGYGFYDAGTQAAERLMRDLGIVTDELPIVAVHGGPVLVRPTNVEVAAALGVKTSAAPAPCDVAVVGAGPAGLAAAVYASSEGLRTVVVEREAMGGQAATSSLIRNYLGFPRGVSGAELARRAYSQAWHFGTEFVFAQEAAALRTEGQERVVALSGGTEIRARAVVLATGVSYRRLDAPGIDRLLGAGVFYGAAASEASAMAGQHVYVIGGANSAGQAALHLARFARRVTLLVRGSSLGATMSAYLVAQIERADNIDVRLDTRVIEGRGEHRLEGLLLETARGEVEEVPAVAVFILIGAAPHTEWLAASVQRDERGFLLTGVDVDTTSWPLQRAPLPLETSLPGVFAVGDVRHRSVKRVASAVGEGSVVLSYVHQYLGT